MDKEEARKFSIDVQRYREAVEKVKKEKKDKQEQERLSRLLGGDFLWVAQSLATSSGSIQASGVSAAEEAKANPKWFVNWAETKLPELLTKSNLDAMIRFEELREKKENAWSNRIKKAFWYIVGSIVAVVLGAFALYYIALAGFKLGQ
jgi:hypothetical protein